MTETTFYRWRQPFGGLTVSAAQRLHALETEHARLQRLLAAREVDIEALRGWVAQ
jgi:putative transposase